MAINIKFTNSRAVVSPLPCTLRDFHEGCNCEKCIRLRQFKKSHKTSTKCKLPELEKGKKINGDLTQFWGTHEEGNSIHVIINTRIGKFISWIECDCIVLSEKTSTICEICNHNLVLEKSLGDEQFNPSEEWICIEDHECECEHLKEETSTKRITNAWCTNHNKFVSAFEMGTNHAYCDIEERDSQLAYIKQKGNDKRSVTESETTHNNTGMRDMDQHRERSQLPLANKEDTTNTKCERCKTEKKFGRYYCLDCMEEMSEELKKRRNEFV